MPRKKTAAQLDREIDSLTSRPRRIVQLAIKETNLSELKALLREDRDGRFEQKAKRLLESSEARARELGMSAAQVDEAVAIQLLLGATGR